ncbi:MAG: 4-(cytidine 5'-diphospho)-2-C-methyl-D-erythritol kinase [Coriobacteriia bacterium]|nr:4-(cytidine 5'-diphospho)-2-C-methyl-D-erythritol kinase [Coriobacteriia bacterium]
MRLIAPAKINLLLAVGGVRPDGYHDVTTVLHALELADEVTIEPSDALELECDRDLGVAPESNLAYRAAAALGAVVGRVPRVRIRLAKIIPHGAGLGGGSSDAAAVLAGLAAEWGLVRTDPRVIEVAASLGADVAFFLSETPCALMTERGDRLARSFAGFPGFAVVLVKPPEAVSTAAAYAAFDRAPVPATAADAMAAALDSLDEAAMLGALANNLERAASDVVGAVGEALEWVGSLPGVHRAIVAGSGSACVALCEDDRVASGIAVAAKDRGLWSAATRLGRTGVRIR